MDRFNVHRSAARKLHERGAKWLDVEWLPGYAPDLNPVEALWSHAKYTKLANFVPADFDRLQDAVAEVLDEIHFLTPVLLSSR
jgi:transposase